MVALIFYPFPENDTANGFDNPPLDNLSINACKVGGSDMSSSRRANNFVDGDWIWNFNVKSLSFSFNKIFMRLVNTQYRCICIFAYT